MKLTLNISTFAYLLQIGSTPGFEDGNFESAKLRRPAGSYYNATEDCLYFLDSEVCIWIYTISSDFKPAVSFDENFMYINLNIIYLLVSLARLLLEPAMVVFSVFFHQSFLVSESYMCSYMRSESAMIGIPVFLYGSCLFVIISLFTFYIFSSKSQSFLSHPVCRS